MSSLSLLESVFVQNVDVKNHAMRYLTNGETRDLLTTSRTARQELGSDLLFAEWTVCSKLQIDCLVKLIAVHGWKTCTLTFSLKDIPVKHEAKCIESMWTACCSPALVRVNMYDMKTGGRQNSRRTKLLVELGEKTPSLEAVVFNTFPAFFETQLQWSVKSVSHQASVVPTVEAFTCDMSRNIASLVRFFTEHKWAVRDIIPIPEGTSRFSDYLFSNQMDGGYFEYAGMNGHFEDLIDAFSPFIERLNFNLFDPSPTLLAKIAKCRRLRSCYVQCQHLSGPHLRAIAQGCPMLETCKFTRNPVNFEEQKSLRTYEYLKSASVELDGEQFLDFYRLSALTKAMTSYIFDGATVYLASRLHILKTSENLDAFYITHPVYFPTDAMLTIESDFITRLMQITMSDPSKQVAKLTITSFAIDRKNFFYRPGTLLDFFTNTGINSIRVKSIASLVLARGLYVLDSTMDSLFRRVSVTRELTLYKFLSITTKTLESIFEHCPQLETISILHCPRVFMNIPLLRRFLHTFPRLRHFEFTMPNEPAAAIPLSEKLNLFLEEVNSAHRFVSCVKCMQHNSLVFQVNLKSRNRAAAAAAASDASAGEVISV